MQEIGSAASWPSRRASAARLDERLEALRTRLEAATTVPAAASALVAAVVPAVADWSAVDLVDPHTLTVHELTDGELVPVGALPATPSGPLSRVLVGGRGTDLPHAEGQGPSLLDDRHAARLDAARAASHSVLPLQTQGRVLGAP